MVIQKLIKKQITIKILSCVKLNNLIKKWEKWIYWNFSIIENLN